MTWSNGRQLDSTNVGGMNLSYSYNAEGQRTSKTRSAYYTDEYVYYGTQLSTLIRNGVGYKHSLTFIYDDNGQALGFYYDTNLNDSNPGTKYYYVCNAQGDVLQLRDHTNAPVANYYYDSWGKLLGITDANGNAITAFNSVAVLNPIRYRGYFYDTETGFYYLNSRYYDPQIGRFINADDVNVLDIDQGSFLQYNLYAYCLNNPVNMTDSDGYIPFFAITGIFGAVIGGVIGYAKTGSWQGALKGAAIGGVAGLIGGGAAAKVLAGSALAKSGAVIAGVKSAFGIVSTTIYSSWQAAEQALRSSMNSVQAVAKRTFNTPMGNRIADAFNKGLRKLGESKYGYQSLTSFIRQQINKDAWLLQNDRRVTTIEWHFYHSKVSNSHGMSTALRKALHEAGIKIVEHY